MNPVLPHSLAKYSEFALRITRWTFDVLSLHLMVKSANLPSRRHLLRQD